MRFNILFAPFFYHYFPQVICYSLRIGCKHCSLIYYAYSIQIFCDFSGYSDMAVGLGLMFGVRLPYALLPRVVAFEMVEEDRFWFDVSLRVPLVAKVEQFVICEADEAVSAEWHARLLNGSDYPLPGVMPIFSGHRC